MVEGSAVFVLWSVKTLMQGSFSRILSRHGQDMTVYTQATPQGTCVRAFFQPMHEKGTEQSVPSPLGRVKQDRFLYLGPPAPSLDESSLVKVDSQVLQVQATHLIYAGAQPVYRWAVLTHSTREVVK